MNSWLCVSDQAFAADHLATPNGLISIWAPLDPIQIDEERVAFSLSASTNAKTLASVEPLSTNNFGNFRQTLR
jgi:hypothetical protein